MQFTKFLPNQGGRAKCLSGFVQRRSTTLFLMRVSVFYVALISGSIQLSLASTSSGQKLDETYVTVELNQESLQALFEKIEKQTNFLFTFPEGVKSYSSLTLAGGRRSVKETLDMVLKDTPVTYKQINGNLVAVFVGDEENKESFAENPIVNVKEAPMVLTVTGTVKDALTQEVLAGVNVIVKGTTRGTTTDAAGKFSIDVDEDDVLVFSFIGFKSFETQLNGRSVIDVSLEESAESLDEIVVNGGYYKISEEMKTGNIAKVTAKDIEKQPVTSPLMALQGRMAGVDITPFNGVPGNAPQIRIRGQNSLRTGGAEQDGNLPLYIIDGVPVDSRPILSGTNSLITTGFDPLSTINPANIESMEVLKDADATAIYGSRGANGVVLITTKQGAKGGNTNLDVSVYHGVGKVTNMLDLLSTQQYLDMRKEAYANDGMTIDGDTDLVVWDTTRYTDWQDVLFGGTSKITDIQASTSGGNSNTSFRIGGGFHKETLVFPGDFGYQRLSGQFSLNHVSPNQKFRATVSTNYGFDKNNLFDDYQLMDNALNLPPDAPKLYDEYGELNWENRTWTNPLSRFRKTQETSTHNLVFNSNMSYEILPGLSLKANLGYTDLSGRELAKNPLSARNPVSVRPTTTASAIFGSNRRNSWIIEPQVTFSRQFNNNGLNAVVGTTFQESTYESQIIGGYGYTSDVLLNNITGAGSTVYLRDDNNEYRYAALFARIAYDWKQKYLLTLTGRRDGSSRFGPGKRFANFGSVGAAWIFSKESFISDNLPFLSFGKLRGSYGSAGSDQIGDYKYFDTYSLTAYKYQDRVSLSPTALFNPDYAWERTKKIEAAIELGFIDRRISVEVSWYRNRSSNQLVPYQLPTTTGFSSVLSNLDATIENTGWEILVNTTNVRTSSLTWTTSINFTAPRNKLVEFPNLEESPYSYDYIIGEPLSISRFYKFKGVNQETGLYEVEDLNGDDVIDDDDRKVIKNIGRQYYGGVNNTVTYKSFELSFLIQFSKQIAKNYVGAQPGTFGNQQVGVLDRWAKPGDITTVQRFGQDFGDSYTAYTHFTNSDGILANASFIRLKTLSLSYRLPTGLLGKIGAQDTRLYVQGQNLFTMTDYEGLDPESLNALPPLKVLTLGVQLKF